MCSKKMSCQTQVAFEYIVAHHHSGSSVCCIVQVNINLINILLLTFLIPKHPQQRGLVEVSRVQSSTSDGFSHESHKSFIRTNSRTAREMISVLPRLIVQYLSLPQSAPHVLLVRTL